MQHRFTSFICLFIAAGSGCVDLTGVGEAVGAVNKGIVCGFRFSFGEQLDSDNAKLVLETSCGDVTDCSDRTSILRGTTMPLGLELPAHATADNVRIESSDPSVAELEGFEPRVDYCTDRYVVDGTMHFTGVGPVALVVTVNGSEFDRKTWTSHEAAAVELQMHEGLAIAEQDGWSASSKQTVNTLFTVRARVSNAEGERLLSGGDIHMWIEDESVLRFEFGGDGRTAQGHGVLIAPVSVGTTTLHVVAWNLEDSVEVTVPEGFDADGGVP